MINQDLTTTKCVIDNRVSQFFLVNVIVNRRFNIAVVVGNIINSLDIITISQVTWCGLGSVNRVTINRW